MFFEAIIKKILTKVGIDEPIIKCGSKPDDFLKLLGNNLDRSSFYKNFTWGDSGNPGYIDSHYPAILRTIIQKLKEDTLMIVTRDDDGIDQSNLCEHIRRKTIETVTNPNRFKIFPEYQDVDSETIHIQKANDPKVLEVKFGIIPINLESQTACAIINADQMKIDITGKTGHKLLSEIADSRAQDESELDLIAYALEYILEEEWVKRLCSILETYFINRRNASSS